MPDGAPATIGNESWVRLLVRAVVLGTGIDFLYLGAAIASGDYSEWSWAGFVPGAAFIGVALFRHSPSGVVPKVIAGVGGLVLMFPLLLWWILVVLFGSWVIDQAGI